MARNLSPADVSAGMRSFDAGSYLNLDQPASRLIQTLMEELDLPAEFLRREMNDRKKRQASQIYDVTAWSLPLMHGVKTNSCARS